MFLSLTLVEELDLGQNRIKSIDSKAFAGLEHLRVLYLDDNDLQNVHIKALGPLPHLAELNLALNNIKECLICSTKYQGINIFIKLLFVFILFCAF